LESAESGGVWIAGEDVTGAGTSALRSAGLAVIPEDRHTWGLILDMTVAENIAMSDIPAGAYSKTGLLDWRGVRRRARQLLEEYDVRPPDPDLLASSLSGGNQQKVVLARELSREPRVLLADNPTWGLDVGAIDYVHRRLLDVKHSGAAVLLLSMDLEELLKLSDRLIVLFRGVSFWNSPSGTSTWTNWRWPWPGDRPQRPSEARRSVAGASAPAPPNVIQEVIPARAGIQTRTTGEPRSPGPVRSHGRRSPATVLSTALKLGARRVTDRGVRERNRQ
ncbi:MAG: ATP-binding cassette domain-containing protein, partial [Acidimicrobiia bacterium]|nr:ATP-binding cassette domain-containing protein [Acidimicrobiia bacterium]